MSSIDTKILENSQVNTKDEDQLMLVEIFNKSEASHFRFMNASEIANLKPKHRILYQTDIANAPDIAFQPAAGALEQADAETAEFLRNIETALNSIGSVKLTEKKKSSEQPERHKISSISSYAMDAATDAFFDVMEQNIDRWTYDASSNMLSTVGMSGASDITSERREAAGIQVKSNKFNTEFRAFFIESLVSFKCEEPTEAESAQPTLELVGADHWKSHNIEPLLSREYEGETKVEFCQLNRRLSVILDRNLTPDENVLGPKAIARTVAMALNECNYSREQREVLEPIIIADFNQALERLYRQINQIWIELDILPEIRLQILKSDVA